MKTKGHQPLLSPFKGFLGIKAGVGDHQNEQTKRPFGLFRRYTIQWQIQQNLIPNHHSAAPQSVRENI